MNDAKKIYYCFFCGREYTEEEFNHLPESEDGCRICSDCWTDCVTEG